MSPLVGTWSSAYGGVGNDSVGELVLWIGLLAVVLVASRIRLQVAWVASAALCCFNPWFFAVLVVESYRTSHVPWVVAPADSCSRLVTRTN